MGEGSRGRDVFKGSRMVKLCPALWSVWVSVLCARHSPNVGTYNSSFSWFEVSLLREDKEVPGSRHIVQHNVHGQSEMQ